MTSWLQDIRYALRALQRNPGYAAVAVLTLSLAIGLNSAIFSVTDVLLFRPLLLADMDRLVSIDTEQIGRSGQSHSVAAGDYYDWRDNAASFERLTAYNNWDASLTGAGDPERVRAFQVTWEFFDTIGVQLPVGRGFLEEEDTPGQHRVAVLSHELWERRFGADERIVGQTIQLDGASFEVVGVAPPQVRFPATADLWVPLALSEEDREDRGNFWLRTVGRLGPGVSVDDARAEIGVFSDRIREDNPDTHRELTSVVYPLRISVSGIYTAQFTRLLLWTVSFVLLIACLNVAALQFARITARERELTIRLALGSGRWRLLRIVLVENLVVAAAGAGLGLLLAHWGVGLIKGGMPPQVAQFLPGWHRMAINGNVVLFTLAVAVVAGLAAGVLPSMLATRVQLRKGLSEGQRSTGSRGRHLLRNVLVVSEVLLALMLMVGASMMVRSFRATAEVAPAIEPDGLLTFRLALPDSRYPDREARARFHERLLEELNAIPGVESAGVVSALPYSGSNWRSTVTLQDRVGQGPSASLSMTNQVVNEDYWETMRIPLVAGRLLEPDDATREGEVAVVNRRFARTYFPEESAVGKRLKLGFEDSESPWITIVGVAGDVRFNPEDPGPNPTLYRSVREYGIDRMDYALRASGDPVALVPSVREAVQRLDAEQPIYSVRTMSRLIADQQTGPLYLASFMSVFGALALVLALVGVYSVTAHSVAERTREIGVRIALGAESGQVLRMTLGRGLRLTAIGLAGGLALSFVVMRLLSGLVFGVDPYDPLTLGGITALFLAAATAACLLPARRAARTDPMTVLRYE